MTKTLFIGDSHAHGYYDNGEEVLYWQENNYAEHFATYSNCEVIIYSIPGASNEKYPTWIKSVLEKHKDVDRVVIQSTYWDRYVFGASKNLDLGFDLPIDAFMVDQSKDKIIRYTDNLTIDNYIETVEQIDKKYYDQYNGLEFNPKGTKEQRGPFDKPFEYVKLFNELITHLQTKQFCKDLTVIDTICREYNVSWFLWRLNDRVTFPTNFELYSNLDNGHIFTMSAETYFKEKNIDIDKMKLDVEHYTNKVHQLIAKDFLPKLLENA